MASPSEPAGFFGSFLWIVLLLVGSLLMATACVVLMGGVGLVAALFALIGVHYVVWGRALTAALSASDAADSDDPA